MDTTTLPLFTYDSILRKAKTVDVIWFNERGLPSDFYEIEHTTEYVNVVTTNNADKQQLVGIVGK